MTKAVRKGTPETGWRARRRLRRSVKKARLAAMSRRRRTGRLLMILGTWWLGVVAALMVGLLVAFYTLTDVPRPEDLPLPQVATIEYSDGSTMARIGSVDRTIVSLSQVPSTVRWAVLAAEDRGFYTEPGVSLRGTVRAATSDLTGGDTQGGSGITQQYVKNAYTGNARTVTRKLKELLIAVKLSRQYAKDQILEYYLNTVYFGRGAFGIQAAAHAYFGVDVSRLTTAQGALLAGVLRAPAYYDPAQDPTAAHQRWQYVLAGMVTTKHLSAEAELAEKFPATKPPRGSTLGTTGWKYLLVNRVLAELATHGISADDVNARGLIIRTTIDRKAQAAAVSALTTTFAHLTVKQRNLKNALVAVDPKSGGVLAYYGGSGPGVAGYDGGVDFNDWAAQRANPAGSAFKPYVLATVLTQTVHQSAGKDHLAIDSVVDGSFCRVIEGTKICNDPSDKERSSARIKLALAMKYSLNTTFDLLALDAGPSTVAATAHALGVAPLDSSGRKTLVDANGQTGFGIGIGDYAVTPLDQASGYATLAAGGVRRDAHLVQQATDSAGSVVYRFVGAATRAVDPRVANDVTRTLEPIAKYSGDALRNDRASAAKTGTEGIGGTSKNNSDAWMVGFTPSVSAAVWVGTGFRDKPIYDSAGKPLYGSNLPGRTWKLFMDTYLRGTPHQKLPSKQQIAADGLTPTSTPTPSTPTASSIAPSTASSTAPSTASSTAPASPTSRPSATAASSTRPAISSSKPSSATPQHPAGSSRRTTPSRAAASAAN